MLVFREIREYNYSKCDIFIINIIMDKKYLIFAIFTLAVLVGAAAIYVFFLMAPREERVYKLGILQFADAPVPKAIIASVLKNLKEKGFGENNLEIIYPESPASDRAKAAALIDYFSREKVDAMLVTNSVGAKIAFEKEKEIPVVFVAVAKPAALGIIKDYVSSGNNFTGVEFTVPLGKTLELIKSAFPNFTNIGVLYSQNEPSPVLFKELKEISSNFGFQIVGKQISENDFEAAADYLAGKKTDLVYLLPDSTLVPHLKQLKQSIDKRGLALVGNTINEEYLLSLVADPEEMGFLAADLIVKILNGNKPSVLSVQTPQKFILTLNEKEAAQKGIVLPEWLARAADWIVAKEGNKEKAR